MLHRQIIQIPSIRQKFSNRDKPNCYKSIDYIRQNGHRSPKSPSNRYHTMSIAQTQQFLPHSKVNFKRKNLSFSFQQQRKRWLQLQKQQIYQIKRQLSIDNNRRLNKLSPILESKKSNTSSYPNLNEDIPILKSQSLNTHDNAYRQIIDRVALQNQKSQLNGLQQAKVIFMKRLLFDKRAKTQQIQNTMNILDQLPNSRASLSKDQLLLNQLQKDLIHQSIFCSKNIKKKMIRIQAFQKVNDQQKQVKNTKKAGSKKQEQKILSPWNSSKKGTRTLFFQELYFRPK